MRLQPRHLLRAGVAAAALEVPALVALGFPRLALVAPLALLAGCGIGYFSATWRATLGREIDRGVGGATPERGFEEPVAGGN